MQNCVSSPRAVMAPRSSLNSLMQSTPGQHAGPDCGNPSDVGRLPRNPSSFAYAEGHPSDGPPPDTESILPAAVDTAAKAAEEQARQPAKKEQTKGGRRPNHGPHPPAVPKGCLTKFPDLIAAAVDCWRAGAPNGRPQSGGHEHRQESRLPPHLRGSFIC